MAIESTVEALFHENVKGVAAGPSWASVQKQIDHASASRMQDQYALLAYQNAVTQQQLQAQSALDYLNDSRQISKMVLGSLADKILNIGSDDAVAQGQLYKSSADASIMSVLGQLAGGSIGNKTATITPPETGVANAALSTALGAAISSILTREPIVRDTAK